MVKQSKTDKAGSNHAASWLIGVLAFGVIIVGAYLGYPYLVADITKQLPKPDNTVSIEPIDITPLTEQIHLLEARLAQNEKTYQTIQQSLLMLQNQLQEAPMVSTQDLAYEDPEQITPEPIADTREPSIPTSSNFATTDLPIIVEMKDTLVKGEPIEPFLDQLTALYATDAYQSATLQPLRACAHGIYTSQHLEEEYQALIHPFLDSLHGKSDSITSKTKSLLSTLVHVRKIGPQDSDDPESLIAHAESQISNGQLKEAIQTLTSLSYDKHIAKWRHYATQHLRCIDHMQQLYQQSLQRHSAS